MIAIEGVTKAYAQHTVLGPVTTTIDGGGITALIGPNGAGKSTLLTTIGRLLRPSAGRIEVDGIDVQRAKADEVARVLAILTQEHGTLARLTVRDLVGFGRFPHARGRMRAEDAAAVDRAIERLELTDLQGRFLDELSGGQRQRAYVAMVLAQETPVVLLDEPLSSLDLHASVSLMGKLRAAAREIGTTVVMVVHDVNIAAAYADRIIALRGGVVVASGSVREVIDGDVLTDLYGTPIDVFDVRGVPMAVPIWDAA